MTLGCFLVEMLCKWEIDKDLHHLLKGWPKLMVGRLISLVRAFRFHVVSIFPDIKCWQSTVGRVIFLIFLLHLILKYLCMYFFCEIGE